MLRRIGRGLITALVLALGAMGISTMHGFASAGWAAGSGGMTQGGSKASSSSKGVAIFAGGCFWCMEEAMEKLPGVKDAVSGYIGGRTKNPTYRQVSAGRTGHTEAVRVIYDPKVINYSQLLKAFWRNIDPLAANRQFCDSGSQYRAGIFYLNDKQKKLAVASKAKLIASKKFKFPIQTEVTEAGPFYRAEEYHQAYYKKNPIRYNYYKYACGRKQRLEELWGPPAKKSS